MHSSVSLCLLLIPSSVFISATELFVFTYVFFISSSSLLKCSLFSQLILLTVLFPMFWILYLGKVFISLFVFLFFQLRVVPLSFNFNFLCFYAFRLNSYLWWSLLGALMWECPCADCTCPVLLVRGLDLNWTPVKSFLGMCGSYHFGNGCGWRQRS